MGNYAVIKDRAKHKERRFQHFLDNPDPDLSKEERKVKFDFLKHGLQAELTRLKSFGDGNIIRITFPETGKKLYLVNLDQVDVMDWMQDNYAGEAFMVQSIPVKEKTAL